MQRKIKILHLEDSPNDSELIHAIIESSGIEHDYYLVDNKDDFVHFLGSENIDIIISDYSMPGYQGSEALKIARQHYAHIPFIFVSGTIGEDRAIEAMLNGATDYVLKNKLERLVPAIKRAMREYDLEVKRKQTDVELKQKRELIKTQNLAIEKRSAELIIANKKLIFQNLEKEKRAAELIIANKKLTIQNNEKEKRAAELVIANEELVFQTEVKEKRAAELIIANKELAYQNREKEKRAAELVIANEELSFQTRVKEKRAAELIIANKELAYQNKEKEKRAAELAIANEELAYQNVVKEKRAAELIVANKELAYQNKEREMRAEELIIANQELAFQNGEKEKRAAELIVANKELAFQNGEKENRAKELIIANEELAYQNVVKEKRAAELIVANKELAYQNKEREMRAEELIIANQELAFQNNEKEKRAAELVIANKELAFQNGEKENRAKELIIANKELAFQNEVKEKKSAELIVANEELAFQNNEKEKRAAELIIANKELAFQNGEKEKRAAELIIANKELAFQNDEKEKRAAELIVANKELVFQNEEKEKRAAELIVAKEHAEESDRLKSAFLANMSHEIRTPMNGILGFADLLKQADLSGEEQQEYIKIIEKSGARMLNIINDIVNISKIEAGQMEVYLSKSNINEQIDFIYTFFKPEIEKKGIQFLVKKSLPSETAIITTDREKIFAILTNLVKNAIKFTTDGTIEFGYEIVAIGHDPLLQFYVKDTGMGIPKDRQEAIFERFIQADIADKMALQGAGLGLSITKAYVELLGGKIWVKSEKGKGSVFYFTIPFITKTQEKRYNESPTAAEIAGNQVKKLKILIVEDDPTSLNLIAIATKKYCKEVLKATTGIEAVETCRNNPDIDLILMDIQMPVMNGYEATRKIRKFNKEVVIIAQTAFVLPHYRKLILKSGCNDYISKPISKDELVALTQKYFNKKALNKLIINH